MDHTLSLVKYYENYKEALLWYQDPVVCKQVDNIDDIYDVEKLSRMYRYLSQHGECYYLRFYENGTYKLIGDIALFDGEIAIVISKEYQNRGIGRRAVSAMLERARQLGFDKVNATIYEFNKQSQKMFLAIGFEQIDLEAYCYYIEKNISQ